MTRDEWRQGIVTGFRLGKAGLNIQQFTDLLEIGRLNRRYVKAFERETFESQERDGAAQVRAARRAEALADKHGWGLDMSGGLWWSLDTHSYTGNALAGLR